MFDTSDCGTSGLLRIRLWKGISRHGDAYTQDKNQSRCKKFSTHKVFSFTLVVLVNMVL